MRWLWAKTMESHPIALGELYPVGGDKRTFRILCDQEIAVVHPDDAGWLVRTVEPFMRTVKPIWAQHQSAYGGLFSWLSGSWTCPECWPKIDMSGECSSCTFEASKYRGVDSAHREIYGYDPRAMMPWATNVLNVPNCGRGGPGGPDTLCMPVYGFCWKDGQTAKAYASAFWQDVGQAVSAYNTQSILSQLYAQGGGFMGVRGLRGVGGLSGEFAPSAPVTPKRAINWYPLLALGLGAGIFSVFLARR